MEQPGGQRCNQRLETLSKVGFCSIKSEMGTCFYLHTKSVFYRGQLPDDLPNARFEKKKDLESTAKSLLKHKIKLLTGLSGQDVEQV